jgi:hypothetical protein
MNLSLLRETNCDKIFYSKEVARTVQELKEERPSIVAVLMPSLEELLESRPNHFPYDKEFDDAEDDPVIICHTSGSIGKLSDTVIDGNEEAFPTFSKASSCHMFPCIGVLLQCPPVFILLILVRFCSVLLAFSQHALPRAR